VFYPRVEGTEDRRGNGEGGKGHQPISRGKTSKGVRILLAKKKNIPPIKEKKKIR